MPQAMRIRAQAAPGQTSQTTVRVLMAHEMETGQRHDAAGQPIPAWYIQQVTALLNGRPVLTTQWGTSVAKNPYLQFTLKGANVGDSLAISWIDNRGEQRRDETLVVAATAAKPAT